MKNRLNFFPLLFLALLNSLAAPAYSAAIVSDYFKWKKSNIRVCIVDRKEQVKDWFNAPEKSSYKYAYDKFVTFEKAVTINSTAISTSHFINMHFSKKSTTVHFTGWRPCSVVTNPDAYLLFFDDLKPASVSFSTAGKVRFIPSVTAINVHKFLATKQEKEYREIAYKFKTQALIENSTSERLKAEGKPFEASFYLESAKHLIQYAQDYEKAANVNRNDLLGTLLHEFGHLAGLHHEHERADSISKIKCILNPKIPELDKEKPFCTSNILRPDFGVAFGPYDKDSVMDYCQGRLIILGDAPLKLSNQDKAALKYLFKDLPENDWLTEVLTKKEEIKKWF